MYVHPQEIDYTIDTLFDLVEASGLEFLGFSNPQSWRLEALLGKEPELLKRAEGLSDRQRYRLLELLNPSAVTLYEFFLGRPPLPSVDWSEDEVLLNAIPDRNPCMDGWESRCLFNEDYQIVNLSEEAFAFLQACDANATVSEPSHRQTIRALLSKLDINLAQVRALWHQRLMLLTPA